MNTNLYLTALLFTGMVFISCEKEDFGYQDAFEKSYQEWLNFKESSGNNYRYTVTNGTWAGFAWRTTLTVENGEVIRRNFQYTVFNDIVVPPGGWTEQRAQEILDSLTAAYPERPIAVTAEKLAASVSWTEEGMELGSHEHTSAAPLMTLDQVYDRARNHWLIKRDDASVSFESNNDGLISSCGYWIDGCQDDCFNGITITSIEKS